MASKGTRLECYISMTFVNGLAQSLGYCAAPGVHDYDEDAARAMASVRFLG
jgi:hypothetical protein